MNRERREKNPGRNFFLIHEKESLHECVSFFPFLNFFSYPVHGMYFWMIEDKILKTKSHEKDPDINSVPDEYGIRTRCKNNNARHKNEI